MKKLLTVLLFFTLLTPVFAARNVVALQYKLWKKLHTDPYIHDVILDYRNNQDVLVVSVDCYQKKSLDRIPAEFHGLLIVIHCTDIPNAPK